MDPCNQVWGVRPLNCLTMAERNHSEPTGGKLTASPGFSRRTFLASTLGLVGAGALGGCSAGELAKHAATMCRPKPGAGAGSIDHVVMLMLENRSFDGCFGTYPGVNGYGDHPRDSLGVFAQTWPEAPSDQSPAGKLLPYHLDAATVAAQCAGSSAFPSHDWVTQHKSWNGGKMDSFVEVHCAPGNDGPGQGPLVMSYLDRTDLPFLWSLADNFTLCDNAFCSVIGPTMPNRLYWLSGTIDPDGTDGGPVIITPNTSQAGPSVGSAKWTSMPEVLESANVSWKVYQPPGASVGPLEDLNLAIGFNALLYFENLVSNTNSPLYQKAFLPAWPDDFETDVKSGNLPQVSWMIPSIVDSMHPSGTPSNAEYFVSQVLSILTSNPDVWAKTALFIFFDENGGFFDHVAPPVPPSGTPGEFLGAGLDLPESGGISGPIGLGFRVPLLVVSPYSAGGWINSDRFDHTSALQFLETRFGVKIGNISTWRRNTVGNLFSTLDLKSSSRALPNLPATSQSSQVVSAVCPNTSSPMSLLNPPPSLNIPVQLSMPNQIPGLARRRTTC